MTPERERLERGLALVRFLYWDLGLDVTAWKLSCHLGEPEAAAAELLEHLHRLGYVTPAPHGTWRLTPRGRQASLRPAHGPGERSEQGMGPTGGRRTGSAVCGDRAVPTASSAPGPGTSGAKRRVSTAVRTPDGSPGGRRASRSP